MAQKNDKQIHNWYFAHRLNLVITGTTNVVVSSMSLFNLINDIAVFIKDSYQKMNIFESDDIKNICNSCKMHLLCFKGDKSFK